MPANATLVNFAGGETSPKSRGRFDAPWYSNSARKLQNFIAEVAGPARFRPGFRYRRQTRGGAVARLITFQISNNLSYELEFTPGYLRAYRNDDLLTLAAQTVTGITNANPAVLTVAATTGMANGVEIILDGIVGMPHLNGRQVKLAGQVGNTFQLVDPVTAVNINTSLLPAYVSGGTAAPVYEIASPYQAVDLPNIQVANSGALMYIANPKYVPYKLTVDAYDKFTLSTYVRVNDPFALAATAVTITNIRPNFAGDKRAGAAATLTPAAVTGVGVNFTASAAAFTVDDVGKYLWKIPTGAAATGNGRALITAFVSTTVVTCTVQTDFDATTPIISGDWQVITVQTVVTLASGAVVNSTLSYAVAGVVGAVQANGNTYLLMPYDLEGSVKRYILRLAGNGEVNSSAWGVYVSGGTATPTASQPSLTITGITRGTSTIIAFAAGSVVNENVPYAFSTIVGTVELNGQTYFLRTVSGAVHLVTSSGAEVDSTAWTAYASGGLATAGAECPIAVAFYEGRLVFAGTNQRPACLFLSRAPDSSGNSRYDDFTGGTAADFACFFQLAPVSGSSDYISWVRGGPDYLFCGTFGGPFRISGSGLDIPITPSSINVRQFDTAGAEATMAAGCAQIFFVQRGGTTLRAIKVINPYLATFESADLCLNAEQIMYSQLQRVVLQQGRPDVLWALRADGVLCGLTVHITVAQTESVAGWHRHKIGGASAKIIDVAVAQRTTGLDKLWVVTERVIDGVTRRCVEIMADEVAFPDLEDFFTDSKAADLVAFNNVLYRAQENYVHMDSAATYNGAARGVAAGATMTPGATTGTAVTFTASASVFTANDVGLEIWKKPDPATGLGGGRALITAYVSGTQVTCDVTNRVAFNSTAAIAAGDWYFAALTLYGLNHLEGASVAIVTDGAVLADGGQTTDPDYTPRTVLNGSITLPAVAAMVHVGLPYVGFLETHNLEMGGRSGPAQAKSRNIAEMFIRFMNSLGVEYGTDLYRMSKVEHRLSNAVMDRPAPVFSGVRRLTYQDVSSGLDDATREKRVVVAQRLPLPAIIEFVDVHYDTTDEA